MKLQRKIVSIIMAVLLIFGCVSSAAVAADESSIKTASLPFITISDIHMYPESLMGNRSQEWMDFGRLESKSFNESEAILRHALDNIAKRAEGTNLKYILLPGDLTKDSELEAHKTLAGILDEYTEKYGFQFLVTVGNHDINNANACSFENDTKEPARAITAAEFPEIYKSYGYGDAIDRFAYPENGDEVQGGLSYVYDLDDNYRLISVDSAIYTFEPEPQKPITEGMVTDELQGWIKYWAEKTYEDGKIPFVMVHHNMAPHMEVEPSITYAFTLNNYLPVAEEWASWGLHFVFSGHLHTSDTAADINDDGDVLYDIETDSLTGFPDTYRENEISTFADGHSTVHTEDVDFDSDIPFSFDGVTYPLSSYKNKSFNLCFGGGIAEDGKANITDFLVGTIKAFLGEWIDGMAENGIVGFLKTKDIDLQSILAGFLSPYLSESGGLFSVENIMWFIDDLDSQISQKYLSDPDALYSILEDIISKFSQIEVADVPCTRFLDTIGFGDAGKNGTLNELVLSVMYYWYTGNEDAENDAFLQNALSKFESGELVKKIVDIVLDLVVNDLLQDEILSNVEVRPETLLQNNRITKPVRESIQKIVKVLLKKDLSYKHLIDVFFSLEILPYTDVMDALDGLLISEYMTDSQYEGTGAFIAYVLRDFAMDSDPYYKGDHETTYSSDKVEVPVNRENYRIPSNIAVTLGEDAQTSANISFYSKYTLSGDIEIIKASTEPEFSGVPSKSGDFNIDISTEATTLSYPGIDLGVLGLFTYTFPVNRTIVKLTGLEKNSTYYYRVGNAERNWWSGTGKITTADGSNEVTFIHTADPQSQTAEQYTRSWAKVLNSAYTLYPDTDFSINTGDLVDHGDNSKQWAYMFNTASSVLQNTFLMPASGNHEGKGTNSTVSHFVLPNMPKQDTTGGAYYSFDYNNVHVAVLNTENLASKGLSSDQTKWLKNDMKSSDADWKFVVLHKAIYSNGSHFDDSDVKGLRSQLSSLMPELGVDMVFQGHDHVYLRTGVMKNNKVLSTDTQYLSKDGSYFKSFVSPSGTIYAISGTAGVKTYLVKDSAQTDKEFPRAEKMLAVDYPMFSAVEVKDKVLYFSAYTVDENGVASPVDRIAIQKDISQGDVAEDYQAAEDALQNETKQSIVQTILDWFFKIIRIIINIIVVIF